MHRRLTTMWPLPGAALSEAVAAALLGIVLLGPAIPSVAAEEGYVSGLSTYPLRDIPQFSADPVARLATGSKILILEERTGWIRVKAGDRTGWMPESVVGREAPPLVQLAPLKDRMEQMERSLNGLNKENGMLREENLSLNEQVSNLRNSLEKSERSADRTRNLQRTWDIALGGGLVIFGWITGYALAAASRRKTSNRKYVID